MSCYRKQVHIFGWNVTHVRSLMLLGTISQNLRHNTKKQKRKKKEKKNEKRNLWSLEFMMVKYKHNIIGTCKSMYLHVHQN
jgi:hypothetical protein